MAKALVAADLRGLSREELGKDIPVFSIMLGNAQKDQLEPMADLSLGAVFDSKGDLISAFKKVKGYN